MWGVAGLGCGLFGVGAAYFWNYKPLGMNLIGKTPEYTASYIEAYKQQTRNTNAGYAMLGWGAWLVFYITMASDI